MSQLTCLRGYPHILKKIKELWATRSWSFTSTA
jgi:hypothetical protein